MKLKLAVLAAASLLASGVVLAQAKAPEPEYTASVNVGVVSDYRYRGISQSRNGAALQGGADFGHKSGLYIGTWASSIKWVKDQGGDGSAEVDLYGGYKMTAGPVGLDFGVLRYLYPNSSVPPTVGQNPATTELYVAGTYGPATLKYSHAVTNLFGFPDSKNSYYLDLNASIDTGFWGLTFVPHIGYQNVSHNSNATYTDWSLGLGKDFGNGISASLAYVDTNTDKYISANGKDLGKSTVVVGVKYSYSF